MAAYRSCGSSFLSIFCLIIYIYGVNCTEFVPVFMWESSSDSHSEKEVPALATVSADEFKDIVLQKLQNNPVVVIFVEENLSVEDFSWQDEAGEGAFSNLENISSASDALTYLPFVHAPLRAFHHHLPVQGHNWYHLKLGPNGLSNDAIASNETLVFVNLDDATSDEDRPDLLKRHDAVISQVYKMLTKHHENVLAVYTAHHSSWQSGEETSTRRVRRLLATSPLEGENEEGFANNSTLLYAPVMTLTIDSKSYTLQNGSTSGGEDLVISFPNENVVLTFSFDGDSSPGYWFLSNVNVTSLEGSYDFVDTKIGAPLEFSYHCSQEVVFKSGNAQLNISNEFQIQPYLSERTFGSAYDCVYFFTVPIWSGLFVCTLFSIIMAFGLCMIMDIKTMDRFDDPKGKTITINTSE